ncbi:MAG: hypothetical protein PHV55_01235 [Candidatus Omnitrophica bacterium]|nr:hypothetical protein [Candidatus Omnitrophota bacterium]
MNKNICNVLFIFAAILFLSFARAWAQEAQEETYDNEADMYVRYVPSRSAKAQSGRVQIIESSFEYVRNLKLFGELPVELSINPQYIDIRNSTQVELPSHLTGFSTGIETTVPLFNLEKAYFHIGVFPSFYGDQWTFDLGHFRIPSCYYAIYRPNEKLILIGGVSVYPKYEDTVLPVIGFIYMPNDALTFEILPDGSTISYALTKKVTLFLEGGDFSDEYVVSKDTNRNVVLRYSQAYCGGGIKFQVNKNIEAYLSAGAVLAGAFKYRDELGKVSMERGPYVTVGVQMTL